MPTLELRLLGNFQLIHNGEIVTTVNQPRLQSLLAYLVLHRVAPQSRQHLAFTFWPDVPEGQARNNLRQLLFQLRHALPNGNHWLRSDVNVVWWSADAMRFDVADYEAALEQVAAAVQAANHSAVQAGLEQAVRCYAGVLLPSCYDEWILPERERLNQLFIDALIQLTSVLERVREYEQALVYAQQLRQIDPLREETYVTLMRLHALGQDRTGALRVYHQCATLLQAELGVEPGEQVRAAYEQLRNPNTNTSTESLHQSMCAPLIGRHREWQRLCAAWQRSSSGQALFALITGEAGIGKTRLADELLDWSRQQGAVVARTRAYAAEGRLPYGAIADWLRGGVLFGALSRLDDVWLGEIARLLPELLIERPHLAPPGPLTEHWQRQRFFQALAHGVMASGAPLALQFDDLQWCDQETLEWLHFLLRFEPSAILLLVGTLRIEEQRDNPALATLLQSLHRTNQLIEILLAPLDAAETSRMAAIISGRTIETSEALRLFSETEGNPLFITEMAQASLGRTVAAELYAASTSPWLIGPSMPLPPIVYSVMRDRLKQLSPDAHTLLNVAATIGRSFTVAILAQASGHTVDALVAALDELWQRRIIREQGVHAYDFSHDKLRDVAYRQLSPMERTALHGRVARALETVHAAHLDSISAQLAAHYEQAGQPQLALMYYERAALAAQQVFAHAEAIQLLRKGSLLLPTILIDRERDLRELTMQTELGASLVALEGYGAAGVMAAYQRARSLCERLGQPASPPILRALVLVHIGKTRFDEACVLANLLLEQSEQQHDPMLAVEGHYAAGIACFYQANFERSRCHFKQSIAQYKPAYGRQHITMFAQDPQVVCLNRLALDLWCLGYPDQAERSRQAALDAAKQLAHPFSLGYCLGWDALLQSVQRNSEIALAQAEMAVALGHEHQLGQWSPMGEAIRHWALAVQQTEGATASAMLIQLQKSADRFLGTGFESLRPFFLALLADAALAAHDLAYTLNLLNQALALAYSSGEHWYLSELHRRHGEVQLLLGEGERGEQALQRAVGVAHSQLARSFELRAATSLAHLWQRQGRAQDARHLLMPIYSWFTEGFGTPDLIAAGALLGA